jgi:hypothetical protein
MEDQYMVYITLTPSDKEIIKKYLSDRELNFTKGNIIDFMYEAILDKIEFLFNEQMRDSRENLLKIIKGKEDKRKLWLNN